MSATRGGKTIKLFPWNDGYSFSPPFLQRTFSSYLKRVCVCPCAFLHDRANVLSKYGGRVGMCSFERLTLCPTLGVKIDLLFHF